MRPVRGRPFGALIPPLLLSLLAGCGGGDTSQAEAPAPSPDPQIAGLVRLDHGGFTLWYDCAERVSVRHAYTLAADTGSLPRADGYTTDPLLPPDCPAQTSTASYAGVKSGYDRGHLVTANHMDRRAEWLAATNHMSNVVPQVSTFNQGLWLEVENTAECWRDVAPVTVIGGVTFDDASNDHFLASHGVRTPDWFWKLLVTTDAATGAPRAIAWMVPNAFVLAELDRYLVSVEDLEARVGAERVAAPALPAAVRAARPATSWPHPPGCRLG